MTRPKHSETGRFKAKRGDTLIGTIEKEYGVDFGVRADMRLDTFLEENGVPSLSKALRQVDKKK